MCKHMRLRIRQEKLGHKTVLVLIPNLFCFNKLSLMVKSPSRCATGADIRFRVEETRRDLQIKKALLS